MGIGSKTRIVVMVFGLVLAGLAGTAHGASADGPTTTTLRITADDGTSLAATLTGVQPMAARPTVVEFTPYGPGSESFSFGPDYNYLLVQIRGTGDSDGSFDALGPRSQTDVAEVLQWACDQSFSNGDLALAGFSASAIIIYNSLHEQLPCVRTAVLRSGTFDLYRDLLVPGGVENIVPGAGVLALIGAPALEQGGNRLQRNPASSWEVVSGLFQAGLDAGLLHPTLDSWWQQRRFQGDVNHLPILMIDGFYDVESRGAFQAYQALRDDGAHLLVVGGHDGAPAGTDDGVPEAKAWIDHYVRGVDNGVQAEPRVHMLLADGDREDMLAGDYRSYDASDWPVPGTTWSTLHLSSTRSTATAHSLNNGSLTLDTPARTVTQAYPSLPSIPTMTDPPNTAIVGSMGLNTLTDALPFLSEMTLAEATGLSYTTAPLKQDVLAAGPLDLDIPLASTAPETAIWAVLSDVAPNGVAHPLTVGRLDSAYPNIVDGQSLRDGAGDVVQPYGDYGTRTPASLGKNRLYHVELWPVGNRFKAGDRIRLDLVGASAASLPTLPAVNSVKVGGAAGAVLRFPVLPGSDLATALQ